MRASLMPANANYLHTSVLLAQLAACGVRRVVISPGARSTPLTLAAVQMAEFENYVLIDERAAAFFALGLAKADGMPAVLICTSGTAAANYFPAVIEAAQSGVPLIVLSADRPAALRHTGAAQTIDQVRLYRNYARYFAELPPATAELDRLRGVRRTAAEAFAAAMSEPRGPVQINVPLEEPLAPVVRQADHCAALWVELLAEGFAPFVPAAPRAASEATIADISTRLRDSLCGLIVAGPDAARTETEAEAIFNLAKQLGWPLVADVASGLRFYRFPVMAHYDVFLREPMLRDLAPDVVLAFGALPTSKSLNSYLERHRAAYTIRLQPHNLGQDPQALASETIVADIAPLCRELARRVPVSRDSLLWDACQRASNTVRMELDRDPHSDSACEALYVFEAVRALPDGANLVLANSLSIRYADALAAAEGKERHVYVMRGANGIDGTLSHAAGVAAASGTPTLLVTGDLAFLHDLGGLYGVMRAAPTLTILLLNNNGGGIFHFLNVHEYRDAFERIHATPPDVNLAAARDLFGLDWQRVNSPGEISAALRARSTARAWPRAGSAERPRRQSSRLRRADAAPGRGGRPPMTVIAASSIDWHVEWHGPHGLPVLCLVHGFAGSLRTWDVLLPELSAHFRLLLVDLPGHGKTPLPRDGELNLERLGTALGQLIRNAAEGPALLCGYSMGGRLALHTALFAPEYVTALGLLGASPGIEDAGERQKRRDADDKLAARIREKGIAWFAEYWGTLPFFKSQTRLPAETRARLQRARLENDPAALAWCLEHLGTGTQAYFGPRLSEIKIPLLLLAGALDGKYCEFNRELETQATASPLVRRVEVSDAGHAAHIEAPHAVARDLIHFFEPASNPTLSS